MVIFCVISLKEAGAGIRIVGSGRFVIANHLSVSPTPSSSRQNSQILSNDLICFVSLPTGYRSP